MIDRFLLSTVKTSLPLRAKSYASLVHSGHILDLYTSYHQFIQLIHANWVPYKLWKRRKHEKLRIATDMLSNWQSLETNSSRLVPPKTRHKQYFVERNMTFLVFYNHHFFHWRAWHFTCHGVLRGAPCKECLPEGLPAWSSTERTTIIYFLNSDFVNLLI